jgi:hypothetical protein
MEKQPFDKMNIRAANLIGSGDDIADPHALLFDTALSGPTGGAANRHWRYLAHLPVDR